VQRVGQTRQHGSHQPRLLGPRPACRSDETRENDAPDRGGEEPCNGHLPRDHQSDRAVERSIDQEREYGGGVQVGVGRTIGLGREGVRHDAHLLIREVAPARGHQAVEHSQTQVGRGARHGIAHLALRDDDQPGLHEHDTDHDDQQHTDGRLQTHCSQDGGNPLLDLGAEFGIRLRIGRTAIPCASRHLEQGQECAHADAFGQRRGYQCQEHQGRRQRVGASKYDK